MKRLESILANETVAAKIFGAIHARQEELVEKFGGYARVELANLQSATLDELEDINLILVFSSVIARSSWMSNGELFAARTQYEDELEYMRRERGGKPGLNAISTDVGCLLADTVIGRGYHKFKLAA